MVAGRDLASGGSWLGLNDQGVVAAVLNRRGSLGPAPGKRSRGELVLQALDAADAQSAAQRIRGIDPEAYRSFNLITADRWQAFWVRHAGDGRLSVEPLPAGLHMITASELDDPSCPRIRHYLPLFRKAPSPRPGSGQWTSWQRLLACRARAGGDPRDAMCIVAAEDYGTVSASLLALPAQREKTAVWLYADGPPDAAPFLSMPLSASP